MTSASMVERAMGESFGRLHSTVQRFHRAAGRSALRGWVEVDAPANLPARLIALLLGSAQRAGSGALRFELEAGPDTETWTRCFPSHTMRSRLRLTAGRLVEQLGAARLTFELRESAGRLEMRLERLSFLGVRCPRWLLPRIIANESGQGNRMHFHVRAALPWVGIVAAYRGYLVVEVQAE